MTAGHRSLPGLHQIGGRGGGSRVRIEGQGQRHAASRFWVQRRAAGPLDSRLTARHRGAQRLGAAAR
ncbi:hypothetical protein D8674_020236 [Pyrus ussuriensis x Pyrus communis]|uniref:Uncharacterized protein n=1 Tax=Pyrus ussuriensis x Pyrus communis TaxID=2448454 RepID=A0A5N5HG73_9ROSA|nr:hypothetical protein D8674_020236 [Pyrus ussuriensis x Pyrus communis]